MHLISISCVAVLVIESISHVVFPTASQFWHHLLNKIFWQNKMLLRPTIPSFFQPETWNTHIYFFFDLNIFLYFIHLYKTKTNINTTSVIYVYFFRKCVVRWSENSVRFEKSFGNWIQDRPNSVKFYLTVWDMACMRCFHKSSDLHENGTKLNYNNW